MSSRNGLDRREVLGCLAGAGAAMTSASDTRAQSVAACRADYIANAWYDRARHGIPVARPATPDPDRFDKPDDRVRVIADRALPRAPVAPLAGDIEALPALWTHAARVGVAFGAAAPDPAFVRHEGFRQALAHECRIIGSTNGYKVETFWPSPWQFDLASPPTAASGDRIADFARRHGMHLRGHVLVWHAEAYLGRWVIERFFGRGRAEADAFTDALTTYLLTRYRGRMWSWDVVNEILGWEEDSVRAVTRTDSVFHRAYGGRDTYVDTAFRFAREADPSTRLVWCEEGLEADTPNGYFDRRRGRFLANLDKFLARRVPIQGIALQAHLETLSDIHQTKLRRFIAEIAARGLFVEITELDVNDRNFAPNERRAANVGAFTKGFLDVMLDEPAVLNVMTWDFAWRPHGTIDAMWTNNPPSDRPMSQWTKRRCDDLPHIGLPLDPPPTYRRNAMWRAMMESFRCAPDHSAARRRLRGVDL